MNNFYRALGSEWLGTMFLLAAVIGSGITAENLAAGIWSLPCLAIQFQRLPFLSF